MKKSINEKVLDLLSTNKDDKAVIFYLFYKEGKFDIDTFINGNSDKIIKIFTALFKDNENMRYLFFEVILQLITKNVQFSQEFFSMINFVTQTNNKNMN